MAARSRPIAGLPRRSRALAGCSPGFMSCRRPGRAGSTCTRRRHGGTFEGSRTGACARAYPDLPGTLDRIIVRAARRRTGADLLDRARSIATSGRHFGEISGRMRGALSSENRSGRRSPRTFSGAARQARLAFDACTTRRFQKLILESARATRIGMPLGREQILLIRLHIE